MSFEFRDVPGFLRTRNAPLHKPIDASANVGTESKEMLVAFDELLERLDNFAVADESEIRILPNILLRGVTHLPSTFTRKA